MEKQQPPTYTPRVDRPDRADESLRSNQAEKQTSPETADGQPQNHASTPPAPTFQSKFASLSLHQHDRIRLLQFPDSAANTVRQAIQKSWPQGIQDQRHIHNSLELKLKGLPWLGPGSDAMHARRLMRTIFEDLFDAGWVLSLSTDVSKRNRDKDTLIFRQQIPPAKPRDWICVAFSKKDRLRVMDAPEELLDAIYEGIRDVIQEKVSHQMKGVWEVKLRGWPWAAISGDDVMKARGLLLRLFAILESHGFTVYASIDQKADLDSEKGETDTWHCCRPKDWEIGAPVYHW
ncbi:hypothetical protein LTR05_005508 [Lithohypha guttulata]|uniref:Uncharacterized protein n=1 Tax=Lithohypha guttulata TaxID=1690604 RepID=A0AAN7Y5I4_9EURO|nr:hypothetical protein LTR05_005508 [Lithohypha guttulata]